MNSRRGRTAVGESDDSDEGDEIELTLTPKWRKGDLSKKDIGTHRFPWGLPAPSLPSVDAPHVLFERLFSDDIVLHICNESTKYAAQNNREQFKLTPERFRVFLAILLLSGYINVPRRAMYWELSQGVFNAAVSANMTKNEFESILQNLHLADNTNLDPSDKFAKVRPLLNHINEKCLELFVPEQDVSIDEAMVRYFGHHGAKQYMHGKPCKFGYKIWVAATPRGYAITFEPYQGKGTTDKSLGLGGSVVTMLADRLPHNGALHYHLVFDNLFTSLQLLHRLQLSGFGATGTLRANRDKNAPLKSVKEMEKEQKGAYDSVVETTSRTCVVRWKDSKPVTVASTFYGVKPVGTCQRFDRSESQRAAVSIPNSIRQYNVSMGGVDRLDQNIACYMINLRSKKWWWPLFRFMVDLAVNNSFLLYQMQKNVPKMDLLNFRREIVNTYLQKSPLKRSKPKSTRPRDRRVIPGVRHDGLQHWPARGKQRRCALRSCTGTTVYFCEKCDVGLHPECFKSFHC